MRSVFASLGLVALFLGRDAVLCSTLPVIGGIHGAHVLEHKQTLGADLIHTAVLKPQVVISSLAKFSNPNEETTFTLERHQTRYASM